MLGKRIGWNKGRIRAERTALAKLGAQLSDGYELWVEHDAQVLQFLHFFAVVSDHLSFLGGQIGKLFEQPTQVCHRIS